MTATLERDARFWDRAARGYARRRVADPAGYERTLERTRALLGEGDRVLELGCGTGTTALALAGSVQRYLATDLSAGMIAIAEEKRRATPASRVLFRQASVEDLANEAGNFDVVVGFNYLHLVHDLDGTLRRIHALLSPGGRLVTKTGCVGEMNPLLRLALPVARALGKAPHVGTFRIAQLQQRIEAAGFAIEATEFHGSRGRDTRPYVVARKR